MLEKRRPFTTMNKSEYNDLYDSIIKHWNGKKFCVNKNAIINKVESKAHNYNPTKVNINKNSERSYFATMIKSYIVFEHTKNTRRVINRKRKIEEILNRS